MAATSNHPTSKGGRHRASSSGRRVSELAVPAVDPIYARYIGRVGALAVALGVGVAVATNFGAGVAAAEDGAGAGENTSAESAPAPSTPGEGDAGVPSPQPEGDGADNPGGTTSESTGPVTAVASSGGQDTSTNDAGQLTDTDGPDIVEGSERDEPVQNPPSAPENSKPANDSPPPQPSTAPTPTSSSYNDTNADTPASSAPAEPEEPAIPAETPEPGATAEIGTEAIQLFATSGDESARAAMVETSTTPRAVAIDLPETLVRFATDLVNAVLTPILGWGSNIPSEPPSLWAVLAFVRREIERTFFNKNPDAVADLVTTSEETSKTFSVLANDVDDDRLKITQVTQPTNGTVAVNADGTITYTPKANFSGVDTFTYTVSDAQSRFHLHGLASLFGGARHTDTATVVVSVTGVNDAPVAHNDTAAVASGSSIGIAVTANDTDVDGSIDPTTVVVVDQPVHGSVSVNPTTGVITYVSNGGDATSDTFTYQVKDNGGAVSNVATVTVAITPADDTNQAPTDAKVTDVRTDSVTGVVTATVVATDPDGDVPTYTLSAAPGQEVGEVKLDPVTGALRFAPTADARYAASLTDSADPITLTVTISDGQDSATLDIEFLISPSHPGDDGRLTISELDALFERGDVTFLENANGTVRVIDGRFTDDIVLDSADAADVLNQVAGILGAKTGFASAETISSSQLVQLAADDAEVTQAFYRLRPMLHGVPVLGSEVVLVTDGDGKVTGLLSTYNAKLAPVDTVPDDELTDDADAVLVALSALRGKLSEALDPAELEAVLGSLSTEADLVVYDLDRTMPPRLAWRVNIATDPDLAQPDMGTVNGAYFLYANGAEAGQVFAEISGEDSASATAAPRISIYTAKKKENIPGTPASPGSPNWDASTVAAYENLAKVYAYYQNVLGRTSYDGGNAPITATVLPNEYANAFWQRSNDPRNRQFAFGGDLERAVDVVGHEFTHAVINYVIGDGRSHTLGGDAQSGALNEAFADILGNLIEGKSGNDAGRWLVGENSLETVRSMADPSDYLTDVDPRDNVTVLRFYPDDMRGFIGSVPGHPGAKVSAHTNAGIIDHAAYKMMTDPAAAGISNESWARLFYNAMHRMPSDADFLDARAALISASKALNFTPGQQAAVAGGFTKVGIENPDEFKIILRWGDTPVDLDAHLTGPPADGAEDRFHVYFANPAYFSDGTATGDNGLLVADLDYDDTDGAGPERITLRDLKPGEYTFVVHDYSNRLATDSTALAQSGAYVKVYHGQTTNPAVFRVDGASDGTVWTAFKLSISGTEDNYSWTITPVNSYSYDSPELESSAFGVSLPGMYTNGAILNAHGTRAIVPSALWGSDGTAVTFLNAATGKKMGATLRFPDQVNVAFNPTGTRAVVVPFTYNPASPNSSAWSDVMVYDTATFEQIGTTVSFPGFYGDTPLFDSTGTRMFLPVNVLGVTRVHAFDLTTGRLLDTDVEIDGFVNSPGFALQGTRLVIATETATPDSVTRFAFIDTATGRRVGTNVDVPGRALGYYNPDGTRLVAIGGYVGSGADLVQVIDTVTGVAVGGPIALPETLSSSGDAQPKFTADGRVVITTEVYDDGVSTSHVTVIDTRTGALVSTSVQAGRVNQTLISADGSRVVTLGQIHETDTTPGSQWLRVIDTSTGSQIGDTFTAPDLASLVAVLNASGSRVTVLSQDDTAGSPTVTMYAINTATGRQVGQTITLPGRMGPLFEQSISTNGDRAVIVTRDQVGVVRAVVFDTVAGTRVGSVITFQDGMSNSSGVEVSPAGARATLTRVVLNGGQYETRVSVIDTATGALLGNSINVAGASTTPPQLAMGGSRAVLTTIGSTFDPATNQITAQTRVVVIDLATGKRVGETITDTGMPYRGGVQDVLQLTPDGRRALLTTFDYPPVPGIQNVRVTVIDVATGRQVGDTADVPGQMSHSEIDAHGTRALITTNEADVATNTVDSLVMVVDLATGP